MSVAIMPMRKQLNPELTCSVQGRVALTAPLLRPGAHLCMYRLHRRRTSTMLWHRQTLCRRPSGLMPIRIAPDQCQRGATVSATSRCDASRTHAREKCASHSGVRQMAEQNVLVKRLQSRVNRTRSPCAAARRSGE